VRIDRRFWRLAPQEVDPLSWFTGPLVPLVFGALNLVYGGVFALLTWDLSNDPVRQVVGVALCTLACVVVHVLTRPMLPPIGWVGGALALALAVIGVVASAIGYSGSALAIETWWAPFGLALAIGSLGPYLPARAIIVLGGAATAIAVPIAYALVNEQIAAWGPIATTIIIMSAPVSGIAATAAFSIAVVSRILPLVEARSQTMLSPDAPRGGVAERSERERVARLTERAAPFLDAVAESGEVTGADRTLAGQLARQLRDDLVTQSNLTWLESVAWGTRIVVVDPEHRANRMRASQRTALRALLRAILDLPGTESAALLVEFRPADDGSTAVALSLDIELPEGRRIMHLAPYYLALRGAVDHLKWGEDRSLRLSFTVD
jgi:hypothetical protein